MLAVSRHYRIIMYHAARLCRRMALYVMEEYRRHIGSGYEDGKVSSRDACHASRNVYTTCWENMKAFMRRCC